MMLTALGSVMQKRAAIYVRVSTERQYYPPDTRPIIFFLKNRMPDKWRNVQDHNVNARQFKSPEECLIEIRKDINSCSGARARDALRAFR